MKRRLIFCERKVDAVELAKIHPEMVYVEKTETMSDLELSYYFSMCERHGLHDLIVSDHYLFTTEPFGLESMFVYTSDGDIVHIQEFTNKKLYEHHNIPKLYISNHFEPFSRTPEKNNGIYIRRIAKNPSLHFISGGDG